MSKLADSLCRYDSEDFAAESREAEMFALEARLSGVRVAAPLALVLVDLAGMGFEQESLLADESEEDPYALAAECCRWDVECAVDLKARWLAGEAV